VVHRLRRFPERETRSGLGVFAADRFVLVPLRAGILDQQLMDLRRQRRRRDGSREQSQAVAAGLLV
jgi:hypothetical protein